MYFFKIRNRLKVHVNIFIFRFSIPQFAKKVRVKFCQKSDISDSKFSRNFGFGADFSALKPTLIVYAPFKI